MHRLVGRCARPAAALLGVAAALLVGPGADRAAAHAVLTSTTPTADALVDRAPDAVELQFDERVEVVATGAVRVIEPDGGRADRGVVDSTDGGRRLVVSIDAPTRGTYTVAWRVLSEDGHDLRGSFVFHVGVRTGAADIDDDSDVTVEIAGAVGRWTALAGMLAAGGAVLVCALAGPGEGHLRRRTRRLAIVAASGGAAGAGLLLVVQAAQASGRGLGAALGVTADVAGETRTGALTVARGALLLLGAALAAWRPLWRRAAWIVALPLAGATALLSIAGHAWTADSRALAVAVDVVHVVSVMVWIGGLSALLVGLPVAVDRSTLAGRFSNAAFAAAAVVGATGGISAVVELGSLEALTSTSYGQLLLGKVVGFAALVWFGWINRRQLVPLLERTVMPLVRSVRAEVLIGIAVLGVTAVLIDTPPGRDQVTEPFTTTESVSDLTVQATVDPAATGPNDIHLYFFDDAGTGPEPVDAVEVAAATGDIPARRLAVTPITANHVSVYGASLASPGTWTLEVTAVRAGTPTTLTIEVPIR